MSSSPLSQEDGIPLIFAEKKKREWCSLSSIVNYIISLFLLAVFLSCVISIGTVGTIQGNFKSYTDPPAPGDDPNITETPRHACYMFSTCKGDPIDNKSECYFKPHEDYQCEAAMIGFSFVAFAAFVFFVAALVHAVLILRISWVVIVELVITFILVLVSLSLSVMISIGNLITCDSIKKFYGGVKDCDRQFPYTKFNYNPSTASAAMNSSWCVFILLLFLLVIYIIRLVMFLRRRKKEKLQFMTKEDPVQSL